MRVINIVLISLGVVLIAIFVFDFSRPYNMKTGEPISKMVIHMVKYFSLAVVGGILVYIGFKFHKKEKRLRSIEDNFLE
jgi:hypothetical protein